MEGLNSPPQSPLKRKPDPVPAEEGEDEKMLKQQKLDAPLEESADGIQDDEKGQSIQSPADKGKEKNIDGDGGQEPGDSSAEEEGSGEAEAEDEEIDLTDEPLTDMDPDNIMPERTRMNGELVPGTYRTKSDDEGVDGDKEVEMGDEDYKEDLEEYEEQEETN